MDPEHKWRRSKLNVYYRERQQGDAKGVPGRRKLNWGQRRSITDGAPWKKLYSHFLHIAQLAKRSSPRMWTKLIWYLELCFR